jgi:hypothetical protein
LGSAARGGIAGTLRCEQQAAQGHGFKVTFHRASCGRHGGAEAACRRLLMAVGRWASGRTQLAWCGMAELGPQRHGAQRGGSGQQLSAGCTSRPAALLVTGDSECRREGGDCISPEKSTASKFGLAGVEVTRRRWSSSAEVAQPSKRHSSAETRRCAERRMVARRRGALRQRRRMAASVAEGHDWRWGGTEEQRRRCTYGGAGSGTALGQWVWQLRTAPARTGL